MKDKLTDKERLYIKAILTARAKNKKISYVAISESLGISKQALDCVIKNAEDKGYVERRPSYIKLLKGLEE